MKFWARNGWAGLAALLLGQSCWAVPITINTALPVSEGEVIVRQQIHYVHMNDDVLGVSRDVTLWKSITAAGYGVNEKLAIFGVIPLVNRDLNVGTLRKDDSGLADIKVFGRYQIYKKDGPGSTTRIAPFLGVNLPTGKTGQFSDGSVDVFGGLIFTKASRNGNFDGQIKYTQNGKHGGFRRGNSFNLDGSYQFRIKHAHEKVNAHGDLFTVLEGGLEYREKDQVGSNAVTDSGGTTAYIAPGLQYAAKRWIGEAAVKIPVVKELNGTALQPGVTVIASVRVNF
ncbi:MAG TPA: hypothetical protein ENJ42_02170 [Hellea balneolensis]|uniref:Transporter n=1 Tax=Hellea balneolensis TaxID=287478 RepID=A0A7C5QVC8_9PROT|nr:hypothetical protein [Hellea balneolensis]